MLDPDLARSNLQAARERLATADRSLHEDPAVAGDQLLQSGVFEDALAAAGLARALGQSGDVPGLLLRAAGAAPKLFSARGTVEQTIYDLDSGDQEVFVDTSLTTPDTLIRGIYAALAADDDESLRELASLPPETWHSEQVEVAPSLDEFASALQAAARGEDVDVPRVDREKAPLVAAQADALRSVLAGDADGARRALAQLESAIQRAHGPNDPARHLALPVLGLRVFARARGIPVEEGRG